MAGTGWKLLLQVPLLEAIEPLMATLWNALQLDAASDYHLSGSRFCCNWWIRKKILLHDVSWFMIPK